MGIPMNPDIKPTGNLPTTITRLQSVFKSTLTDLHEYGYGGKVSTKIEIEMRTTSVNSGSSACNVKNDIIIDSPRDIEPINCVFRDVRALAACYRDRGLVRLEAKMEIRSVAVRGPRLMFSLELDEWVSTAGGVEGSSG